MALYWITGGSGSGKSTTIQVLKKRGYEAYDVDEVGPVVAKWQNIKSGFVHPKSSIKSHMRTPEFLKEHTWNVARDDVAQLAERADNTTIFLGGSIANSNEVGDLFAGVFALVLGSDTLEQRLISRTNNDWGKNPHELKLALDWNEKARAAHLEKGHIVIDSTQAPEEVANEILRYVHDN